MRKSPGQWPWPSPRLLCVLLAILPSLRAPGQDTPNIAVGKPVSATDTTFVGQGPENMTDGDLATVTHPLADSGTLGFTYEIDLGNEFLLDRIELVNRTGCCPERLSNYRVSLFADGEGSPGEESWSADVRTDGSHSGDGGRDVLTPDLDPDGRFGGRYVHVVNLSDAPYNPQIAEIEVFASSAPIVSHFITSAGNITAQGNPILPSTADLSWSVTDAESVTISGLGSVDSVGTATVAPATTTTFVLTATNASGSTNAEVTIGVDEAVLPPLLTEFMADNAQTLDDQEGDSEDWLELYNRNAFGLDLEGYYLTDDPNVRTKWRFPAEATIPASGHLVVFASEKNLTNPGEPLHTNFKLAKPGDYLALVAPDGSTVLGQFPADFPTSESYPDQKEDYSYGLGTGQKTGFFDVPSPGAANGASFAGFVEDTKFEPNRGFFRRPMQVAITSATDGASIRYTTDGSRPSETHGTLYTGPIDIESTTTLRAAAFSADLAPTNIDTHTYIYLDDVMRSSVMRQQPSRELRNALEAIPSMSIVTPDRIDGTSEVETSFEMMFPDGTPGFQENCGVKQFGGAFTNFEKKNFRMYFRSKYGASKLEYPVFEGFDRGIAAPTKFDQINLRSGSHDMSARGFYMSNRFTDDTMLDMGNINPHGRFVHLYLNGVYWGQYHLRERWNASTLSQYLGGPKEAYEAINGNWNVGGWADSIVEAYDGDGRAWRRIKALADDYEAVQPFLDVAHYVDYMLMFMYGNSEDEYRCVGPAGAGSGFKWFLNDADGFLRYAGNRTNFSNQIRGLPGGFGRSNGDGPASIFSLLFKSRDREYRTLLGDRIHKHFFNDGAMTPLRNRARLAERAAEIEESFKAEAIRWGYRTYDSWESSKNSVLNGLFATRTDAVLSHFRSAGFYPDIEAPVLNQHGGPAPAGFVMDMTAPEGDIYYTVDGSDPRLPGGERHPNAILFDGGVVPETLIPSGSTWRYLDEGTPPPAGWNELSFDDSSWPSGPAELGYGEDDEAHTVSFGDDPDNKHITTYFRRTIDLEQVSDILAATLELKRDDGAVVYLNGNEVVRDNLPIQTDYLTVADRASDDGSNFHLSSLPLEHFQVGANVIAVELHQESSTSSDLSFDLALRVERSLSGNNALTLGGHTFVKMRALTANGWSALNEAFFLVGDSAPVSPGDLAISELHYNPAGPDTTEFIEFMNIAPRAINLRGVHFTDGIDFAFPDNRDIILVPGERIVIVDSQFAMDRAYGLGLPIRGVYRGNLDNDGETVVVADSSGLPLVQFTYNDKSPWPEAADDAGFSLTLIHPGADPANAENWRPSSSSGGTPGTGEGIRFTGEPDEDRDGDGFTAFAEYALGTSDVNPNDARGAIRLGFDEDGHLTIEFPRDLDAIDAEIRVEVSQDLVNWASGPTAAEPISETGQTAIFRTRASLSEHPASFIRLRFLRR